MEKEGAQALGAFSFRNQQNLFLHSGEQRLYFHGPGHNVLQLTQAAFLKRLHFATDLGTRIFNAHLSRNL